MDTPDALSCAAAGMRRQADRLDAIAGDLANASTVGYRASSSAFAVSLNGAARDDAKQGALRRTGSSTDFALVGNGFFAVATPDGVRYTRDGRFTTGTDRSLTDARGHRVLGALGPVSFPSGAHIEPDGRVVHDGRVVDRLRIVDIRVQVDAAAGAYLRAAADAVPQRGTATVHAGYVEESTVDPIAEMTSLVATQRAYEANQKAAQRADETLRRAVTDVPAVRS
jgi:flagellar basal-body rod protein FlgF